MEQKQLQYQSFHKVCVYVLNVIYKIYLQMRQKSIE